MGYHAPINADDGFDTSRTYSDAAYLNKSKQALV
jgi:hypothetical protein